MPIVLTLLILPCAILAVTARSLVRFLIINKMLIYQQPMIDYKLSREYPDVWKAMELLVDSGKAKSIGN